MSNELDNIKLFYKKALDKYSVEDLKLAFGECEKCDLYDKCEKCESGIKSIIEILSGTILDDWMQYYLEIRLGKIS